MATTQMPIDGVFDIATGQLVGFAGPNGPEIPLGSSGGASVTAQGIKVGESTVIEFVNVGTLEVPVYELSANLLPRTALKDNLLLLNSGGGELASAIDVPAIVQLRGTYPLGTAAVYTPMGVGVWSDDSQTLSAVGDGAALILKGAAQGGGEEGGAVNIEGGVGSTGMTGGGVNITSGSAPSGDAGTILLTGASSAASGGAIGLYAGSSTAGPGGAIDLIGGTGANDNIGGTVTLTGGAVNAGGVAGAVAGGVVIKGGRSFTSTIAAGDVRICGGSGTLPGNVRLTGATDTAVVKVDATGKLGFFNVTPVIKQVVTGSRGSGAALTSLLAALVALGLISDTTSA